MNKKSVIAYYRKSTNPKGKKSDEESVAYQKSRIREYAEDHELLIVREFIDVGVTGIIDDWPELLKMFQYLEQSGEEIQEILFYSIDRFGRDTLINIELLTKVVEKAGKATFIRESLSTGVEWFNTLFLIYSGVAQSDRENLLRNLKDGRKAKILNHGNFDGNYTPLGYSVEPPSKRLVAKRNNYSTDELARQELSILETIYRSYLFGKSLRQIAKDLNDRFGFTKRGCEWNYKSVQYILKNSTYIGALSGVLEGTEHYYREDSNVEVLIDPVVFALVQKKLEYESTGRKRKDNQHVPALMLCRFCGNSMEYNQGRISCKRCVTIEDVEAVIQAIHIELERYTKQKFKQEVNESLRNKIILQYQIKFWKMESKLKELLKRKNRIRMMDVGLSSREKMMIENSKLIKEIMKESGIAKGILLFFQSLNPEELNKEFSKRATKNLVQLPFITIIDLVDKKLDLLFLKDILKGGTADGL
ncbi:recombinase family protein [Cytobacillus sp. Hz8]|uniref:recombinase family protein n=1 Tax=Cytobacillus sp. Hz8 TaxID=3347168 RepID=UPI0035DAFFF1